MNRAADEVWCTRFPGEDQDLLPNVSLSLFKPNPWAWSQLATYLFVLLSKQVTKFQDLCQDSNYFLLLDVHLSLVAYYPAVYWSLLSKHRQQRVFQWTSKWIQCQCFPTPRDIVYSAWIYFGAEENFEEGVPLKESCSNQIWLKMCASVPLQYDLPLDYSMICSVNCLWKETVIMNLVKDKYIL